MTDADPPLDAPAAADPDPPAAEPSTSPLSTAPNSTPAQLAALLATALADVESLRAELVATRAKAERSERLLATFTRVAASTEQDAPSNQESPDSAQPTLPASTLALLANLDDRTAAAEAARDDASARLAVLSSAWAQLSSYLAVVEARAVDARAGYERIVKEGGGRLVLVDVPTAGSGSSAVPQGWPGWVGGAPAVYTPPYMEGRPQDGGRDRKHRGTFAFQLPPAPSVSTSANVANPNGRGVVRPRESVDFYPYKKQRGEDYAEYPSVQYPNAPSRQTTLPYPSYPRRDRERSPSTASDDIDAILLAASMNGSPSHHHPPPSAQQGRSPEWTRGAQPERAGSVSVPAQVGKKGKDLHSQPTQTFAYPAPSVAPSTHGSPAPPPSHPPSAAASLTTPASGVPVAAQAPAGPFPATNALNQRICRQCGLPGRYKEGKCVEKWGPGPLGPGTVCDRCRKKMKRVERRGTLEAQQAGAQQQPVQVPGRGAVQRADTFPAPHPTPHAVPHAPPPTPGYREQESSLRSSLASPPPAAPAPAPAPPTPAHPARASTTSSSSASAAPAPAAGNGTSTSTSGRVIKPRMGQHTPPPPGLLPPLRTHSPSPMAVDGEDADAEAEAEEVEADQLMDGDDAEGEADADAEGEGEGDPEVDLLEAVDAAEEANSSGGRVKSEE